MAVGVVVVAALVVDIVLGIAALLGVFGLSVLLFVFLYFRVQGAFHKLKLMGYLILR